jgi:hypothetical protein
MGKFLENKVSWRTLATTICREKYIDILDEKIAKTDHQKVWVF